MDTTSPQENSPVKINKGHYKLVVVIAIVFLICLGVLLLAKMLVKTGPGGNSTSSNTNSNNTSQTLPQKNMLVYTKCYGSKEPNNNCFLYVGSLFDTQPTQTIYPNNGKGIKMTLHGVVNKKAVLTKNESEKSVLSIIDLENGADHDVYTYGSVNDKTQTNGYVASLYLDKQNNKLFFTTEISPGENPKLMQYDTVTQALTEIANGALLTPQGYSDTFSILGGNNGKLFLTVYPRGGSVEYQWIKTFTVATKTFEDVKDPKVMAVFDSSGQHVAYLKELNKTATSWDRQLIVENVDGTGQKIIYTVKSVLPGLPPYPNIGDYAFNSYGDILSFAVSSGEKQVKNYLSYLQVRKDDPDIKVGIILEPPNNPNIYKNLVEFTPPAQPYQWAKFYYPGLPTGDNPEEGILYQDNQHMYSGDPQESIWYITSTTDKDFPGNEEKIPVLINAKQVYIIPK